MAHRRAWKIHIRFPDQPDAIERALEGNSVFIGWGRCGQPLLAERRRHPADGSKPSPKFKSLLHRVYYAEDAGRRRSGQAAPSAWNFLGSVRKGDWVLVPRQRDFYLGRLKNSRVERAGKFWRRDVKWLNRGEPIAKGRVRGSAALLRRRWTCEDVSELLDGVRAAVRASTAAPGRDFQKKSRGEILARIGGGRQRKGRHHNLLLNRAAKLLGPLGCCNRGSAR